MQSFLKVTNIEPKADKNGRSFQTVTFSEIKYLPNGQEILTGKVRVRNLWSTTDEIKGDTLYNQLNKGSLVEGSIQEFNTTTFTVNDRAVNKTTLVVFSFENPVSYANQQLKRNGAVVVDEHGQLTAPIPTTSTTVKQAEEVVTTVNDEVELEF